MTFIVNLVFVFLFYIVPLYTVVAQRWLVFPVLGHDGSWLLTAAIIYVALALSGAALKQFEDLLVPAFPAWRVEVTRRTGIYRLDSFGLMLAIPATILFLSTDIRLAPLGVVSVIGFASLMYQNVALRPVKRTVGGQDPGGGGWTTNDETRDENQEEPVARRFQWQVNEALETPYEGDIELIIDKRRYERYSAANPYAAGRPPARNYQRLVSEGITKEIRILANDFRAIADEQNLSSYQMLVLALTFVQGIPYADDQETKGREYIRWPIETLYESIGDSDCKSVLLATLLLTLGYDVIIVEAKGRAAVGVAGAEGLPGRFLTYKGRRYYFCEPSISGGRVGQLPPDLAEGQLRVYPLSISL